jgi:hypothetical protein
MWWDERAKLCEGTQKSAVMKKKQNIVRGTHKSGGMKK